MKPISKQLNDTWRQLSPLPGGRWLFSRLLGWLVPYSGSIRPEVKELRPGYARVSLKDRRRVRNHLSSVHAIALANLGEIVTGLAVLGAIPDDARGILTNLSIDYEKKARGRLIGECHCDPPTSNDREEYKIQGVIRDKKNDIVAEITATWLIGPIVE